MSKEQTLKFLQESNAIESVYDADSLFQAFVAWEYLMSNDKLTSGVVLKTHKILMLHSNLYPNEKGYFRKVMVSVGGRLGLNAEKIPEAIESWIGDVATSIKIPGKNGKHIKLDHITYEKIHPFVDGNGRTGRMLMNWQRIKAKLPILIIHEGEEQQEYYKWFK